MRQTVLVVWCLLLVPLELEAQPCLGAPAGVRVWVGAAVVRTSAEANLLGAEAGMRVGKRVTATAQIDRARFPGGATPDRNRTRLGLALANPGWSVPVCLTLSGARTTLGDLAVLSVPIGVASGLEVPLGKGGFRVISHIEPRLAYRRASLLGFHRVSTAFSLATGSGLTRGRAYGGITFEWTPAEGSTWATGVRLAAGR